MIIHPAQLLDNGSRTRLQTLIDSGGTRQTLWYEVDARYQPYLSTETLDGFLVGLLLLAMKRGEDIEIEGMISERLYYNITNYYQHLISGFLPEFQVVGIKPQGLTGAPLPNHKGGVVAGFSAGIDSLCTVFEHLYWNPPPSYSLTHLLFNNVGAHIEGNPEAYQEICESHYRMAHMCAKELGLELVRVDSNLANILQMSFVNSHTTRNISCALILQRLFGKFLYSSGKPYRDFAYAPIKTGVLGHVDPAANHLLSTETMESIATGLRWTRVEKTDLITQHDIATRFLNVCVRQEKDGRNCSLCWKCCQTLLTLELLGKMEKFNQVFDIIRFRRIRYIYLCSVFARRHDEYIRDIFEYARKNHFPWPWGCRPIGWLLSLLPKPAIKRLLGGVRLLILFFPKEHSP